MRIKNLLIPFMALFLSLPALADTTTSAPMPPDQVIEQTAKQMFAAVNGHQAELKRHSQELYGIIGKILLPHFEAAHIGEACGHRITTVTAVGLDIGSLRRQE